MFSTCCRSLPRLYLDCVGVAPIRLGIFFYSKADVGLEEFRNLLRFESYADEFQLLSISLGTREFL